MPDKKQQVTELTYQLSSAITSLVIDDGLCTLTSDEILTLIKIVENSEDRIKRGIIGSDMVIVDERNKTINKIIK